MRGEAVRQDCVVIWCKGYEEHRCNGDPVMSSGKPTDNAMTEAFNARLREECLNESWFLSLEDARRHYNGERPHGALGNLAPQAFALVATAGVK